jgi:ATP-dependent helicase Lhr and Lhr-like helicase
LKTLLRPTPFGFPLMVELFREKLSNESVAERIARMVEQLEKAAGGAPVARDVDQVRGTLAFGGETSSVRKPRRPRKPSRPLPPL